MITPNPKTSGGARWNYLAAWGYALEQSKGDEARARDFVGEALSERAGARLRRARLDDDVRAARHRRRAGRVGERGAARGGEAREGQVRDRRAVGSDPRRAAGRGGRQGRRPPRHAEGGARRIWSSCTRPKARRSRRSTTTGPRSEAVRARYAKQFPELRLFTIDEVFGGWAKAQKTHFADGGVFDQIYQPGT